VTGAPAGSRSGLQANPWLIAPLVAMAAFMEVIDISIANVALPHIAGALSASQDESTWVLTSYLATNAIVMPMSGWLANRFGRKRFFLTCISGFAVSSLLCGLAPNITALMALRALQGAMGGGLQPMGQAILADTFPREKLGMATALYGVAVVVAPIVGPLLGGWITDGYDWRWIFLINVPIGAVLIVLIAALLPESAAERAGPRSRTKIDGAGMVLIALALGSLQIVFDRGQASDWFASSAITALALVAAVAVALLIWRELHHEDPVVDLRLLANREFAAMVCLMAVLGFCLFGGTFLLPAYAQSLLGYTALDAGMLIAPGGLALLVVMPTVGRLVNRVDPRLLLAIGLLGSALTSWWLTRLYLDAPFESMMLARMAQMASLGFVFIPINTLIFRNMPPGKTNNAAALVNLARNFAGSVGVALLSTVLTRREQFHQSRLVEHLQSMNGAYPDYASHVAALAGGSADGPAALASIYQSTVQQATLLGYLDDFKLLALIFLASVLLLVLVKPGKAAAAQARGGLH
jgi:MFS transporter, DHA2 family, multidrug resistance protein